MNRQCEGCGVLPPVIVSGPWKGQSGIHDFCANCSKDLCAKCLADGKCSESTDGKHATEGDEP